MVLTGPLAIVKVDGKAVGKIRDFRYSENIRRDEVRGLGTVMASEAPVTGWAGSLSCSTFVVDFVTAGIPGAINRLSSSVYSQVFTGGDSFEDNLVLDETGVTIELYKKVGDSVDPVTRMITPKMEPFAILQKCFIEGDGFDVSEGSLATQNQSFKVLTPVVQLK